MSDTKNPLELYVAEKLKKIDKYSRPTKASGASTEIGDVLNKFFFVECKMRDTSSVTIQRKVWYDLLGKLPLKTKKIPIYALENKHKDRFITLDLDDFFRMVYTIYYNQYIRDGEEL